MDDHIILAAGGLRRQQAAFGENRREAVDSGSRARARYRSRQTTPPGIRNQLERKIETYVTVMCKRRAEFCATTPSNRMESAAKALPNATRA